jgi:hypothetical protein
MPGADASGQKFSHVRPARSIECDTGSLRLMPQHKAEELAGAGGFFWSHPGEFKMG